MFDDANQDKFETGYKDDGFFSNQSRNSLPGLGKCDLDSGGMRPDSALLREFGLPVPRNYEQDMGGSYRADVFADTVGSSAHGSFRRTSMTSKQEREEQRKEDLKTIKERLNASAKEQFARTKRGEQMADRFGRMKFREIDENGTFKPIEDLDDNMPVHGQKFSFFRG